MRLDLFLKKMRLVKQRTLAKELCDAGRVLVDGHPAKPSHEVRAEDRIHVQMLQREIEVRVLGVPHGNVARRDVPKWIEFLRDEHLDAADRVGRVFENDAEPGDEMD
jgi:ribosomal 50S subunit-recycling heat shock protein